MSSELIEVESLQQFRIDEVPSFREECLAKRALFGGADNFYLLLQDFQEHIRRLYKENTKSGSLSRAFKATSALLERGTDSVKDATTIQVIDMIIRDEDLRSAASRSEFPTLASAIARQVSAWEAWRQRQRR